MLGKQPLIVLILAALAAPALTAGCSSAIPEGSLPGQPAPPRPAPPQFRPADTVAAPLPPLTDGNILAMRLVSDSAERAMAELARTRATDPKVRDLADMLQSDNARAYDAAGLLARTTGITPVLPAGDTTALHASHVLERLGAAPVGVTFDSAFAKSALRSHIHDIAVTKTMAAMARDDALKTFLRARLPILEKHLDRAQLAWAELGVRP